MSTYGAYLKRVNRFGTTTQERIQNKKEHDFLVFMEESPNLVRAWSGDSTDEYKAVLQTKTYDQDEVVDYLLVPLGTELPFGTIITTEDVRHKKVVDGEKVPVRRKWINYAKDPYTSSGYDRHTVVELDYTLTWVIDGLKYETLCHGVGAGGDLKNIGLAFKTQFSESGVYLPNKRFNVIMPANKNIKKHTKVSLGDEVWRVTGIDNISVPGVSYITLEETLVDEQDKNIVNEDSFYNWTISTNLGEDFTLPSGSEKEITLTFYYNQEERKNVKFSILEDENFIASIVSEDKISVKINDNFVGKSSIKVNIDGWETEKFISIPFTAAARVVESIAIIGPKTLYMGDEVEFKFENLSQSEFENVKLESSNAKILSRNWENKSITIQGMKIGKESFLIVEDDTQNEIRYEFDVLSAWLRGGK